MRDDPNNGCGRDYTLVYVERRMVGAVLNIYVKISFFLDLNKGVDRLKINCRRRFAK